MLTAPPNNAIASPTPTAHTNRDRSITVPHLLHLLAPTRTNHPGEPWPPEASSAFTLPSTAANGGWHISCSGEVQDPHNSKGAGGAIFKTRIKCRGSGKGYPKTDSLTAEGGLGFTKKLDGTYEMRATSFHTQTAEVNGEQPTYYTPRVGSGGRGTGYWLAASIWHFPGSTTGYHSKRVHKTI
jgi:hypothetical protein